MISQGFAPCKDCKRRHGLCHDGCPDYAEFRKRVEEIRAKKVRIVPSCSACMRYQECLEKKKGRKGR